MRSDGEGPEEAATAPARGTASGERPRPPSARRFGGQYRVERAIGGGGMGEVFLARDELLDRWVAVKVLLPEVAATPGAADRFRAEARAMARLRHPHVVGVHTFGEDHGAPYLVMEHVPGESLHRWAARRGGLPIPLDHAIAMIDQICRGVSAIHSAGLVHRDLKPGNVLVGPSSRIAIADLGLAAAIRADGESGERWGTPGYGAPEILDGEDTPAELRARCDVFSAGVMAYELLTGRLPYASDVDRAVRALQNEPPLRPSRIVPTLTPALDAVILEALEIAPERRTRSIDAFRRALLDAAERAPKNPRTLRVLIADDDPDYLDLATRVLTRTFAGARIETFSDGASLVEAARRSTPDLVVTDLDMPELDGAGVIGELRREPATRRVPVLMVSACGSSTDWALLCRVGADAFVSKPFEAQQLAVAARGVIETSSR